MVNTGEYLSDSDQNLSASSTIRGGSNDCAGERMAHLDVVQLPETHLEYVRARVSELIDFKQHSTHAWLLLFLARCRRGLVTE